MSAPIDTRERLTLGTCENAMYDKCERLSVDTRKRIHVNKFTLGM